MRRQESAHAMSRRIQRWLEQNRSYGDAFERYAHPGKRR